MDRGASIEVVSTLLDVRFLPAARSMQVESGTCLFTAAHWLGVPIDSSCGGLGTCGRCRVRIESGQAGISAADREYLSESELGHGWRLACTTPVECDLVCWTPSVDEMPTMAVAGVGREFGIEPEARAVCLDLEPPTEDRPSSGLERVCDSLRQQGLRASADLGVLRQLSETIGEARQQITAKLVGPHLVAVELGDTRQSLRGVAFDLGTTTVVGTLVDLTSGRALAVESTLNDQMAFGGDVISRIAWGMRGAAERRELEAAAIGTLNRLLERLCEASGAARSTIYEVVIVGNCTMLHLLLGCDARSIAVAPFEPAMRESRSEPGHALGLDIHPQGRVQLFPSVGAYVGADTVAGLHAVDIARQENLWLFIDVGTNSEIALGSSNRLLATAAPAGPAFEGCGIRSGMVATRGAIEHVGLTHQLELQVIGGGSPRGICGSGLLDLLAELRRCDLLDQGGRLANPTAALDPRFADLLIERDGERCIRLAESVWVTQRDIRELQVAKSSIATGVRILMERLGVTASDLDAVLLAGSFGSSIDPASARTVGIVPAVDLERIRFVGNVAAEGARMGLLSFRERQVAFELARRIEYVDLSSRSDFNDVFVAELEFPALREVAQ